MSTPTNFTTGIENDARLPGTPPPWANYFIFVDGQGELQFNPPRGSQALKIALEWQFPKEQNYVGRLRKAIELHYESVHGQIPSVDGLETTVFDPRQQISPAASGYTTPTSGFSATSGRRKRGKRDTSCKYHYDKHLKCDPTACPDNKLNLNLLAGKPAFHGQFMASSTSLPQQASNSMDPHFQSHIHNPIPQMGILDPMTFQQSHHIFDAGIPQAGPLAMPAEPREWNPHLQRSQTFPSHNFHDAQLVDHNPDSFTFHQPLGLSHSSSQMSYNSLPPQMDFGSLPVPHPGLASPPGVSPFGISFETPAEVSLALHGGNWTSDAEDHRGRTLDELDHENSVAPKPAKKRTIAAAANKLGLKWLRVRMNQVFL
ncbi:hypothetical protein K505DRAFT_336816 [Melanomma pulvis-pyrius CBS 109.77]|uniref:Uncharacterized protein n=1 Tax=Melanomma pulvis-pyrius CBS 109.77 TaxID=1314802 RepID=A0A6A6XE43_9PLEO|nr:hypothetical protein K505DRAFT_336816 [Melanomma pulvis-pyrius CBS 109.77]